MSIPGVNKLYLGPVLVNKAYLGTELIWGAAGTDYTITVTGLAFTASIGASALAKGFGVIGSPVSMSASYGNASFTVAKKTTVTPFNVVYSLGNATLRRGYRVQGSTLSPTVTYGSATLTKVAAGAVALADYVVALYQTGGGNITFSMSSNGSTSPDTSGWYSPITTGAGTGKWVILTSVSGALSVSGTIGSRVQLSTNPFWTASMSSGLVRNRTFTVQIYDAATGGNLLGTGSLYFEIDGS